MDWNLTCPIYGKSKKTPQKEEKLHPHVGALTMPGEEINVVHQIRIYLIQ